MKQLTSELMSVQKFQFVERPEIAPTFLLGGWPPCRMSVCANIVIGNTLKDSNIQKHTQFCLDFLKKIRISKQNSFFEMSLVIMARLQGLSMRNYCRPNS